MDLDWIYLEFQITFILYFSGNANHTCTLKLLREGQCPDENISTAYFPTAADRGTGVSEVDYIISALLKSSSLLFPSGFRIRVMVVAQNCIPTVRIPHDSERTIEFSIFFQIDFLGSGDWLIPTKRILCWVISIIKCFCQRCMLKCAYVYSHV